MTILNLIADFGDKKAMHNAKAIDEEEKYLVVIQEDKEDFFDLNSITFCEYLVKDKNIEDAIKTREEAEKKYYSNNNYLNSCN